MQYGRNHLSTLRLFVHHLDPRNEECNKSNDIHHWISPRPKVSAAARYLFIYSFTSLVQFSRKLRLMASSANDASSLETYRILLRFTKTFNRASSHQCAFWLHVTRGHVFEVDQKNGCVHVPRQQVAASPPLSTKKSFLAFPNGSIV